ncbi:MAG: DUF1800 domain-containing protein [Acidimicrobiia bacterium]|nr:DUF1800 domain-containing protein [Acidimicrobiia bacterium]
MASRLTRFALAALLVAAGALHGGGVQAQGPAVLSLVVANLSPAFAPAVTQYSIPRTSSCQVPVTVTLAYPTQHRLYIASGEVPSGVTRNAWVCDGRTKIDVVVYKVWTEVARYTINVVGQASTPPPSSPSSLPPPPPPPEPAPTPTSVSTPTGPLPVPVPADLDTAVALLEHASFGPTAASVAAVQESGVEYWLAQQFQTPETVVPDGLNVGQLRTQLFLNMLNAPDQLRQRVAFALGQTLVVSANKNVNGFELTPFVRLLSKYAFSNYRTLLREVTLSPSMGKFLDLANSRKAMNGSAPNENYPRELLQLFSIGLWQLNQDGSLKAGSSGQPVGTYTQADVREVARALTGWTYPTAPGVEPRSMNPEFMVGLMEPRPLNHDAGAKTFLGATIAAGQTVTKDMEDVIDTVFTHPNVPPFVATRLIRSLVTSNPSPGYVTRVANAFVDNGAGDRGDMRAVLTAVLTDEEAGLGGPHDGRLKDPLLHVVGLGRALGAQVSDPSLFMYIFSGLGQMPLTPPTVFSFYSPLAVLPGHADLFGPEFQIYTPALAIQRANFVYTLLSGQAGSSFKVDLAPYIGLAGSPHALVERVNQSLFFGRMSNALRQVLLTATQAASTAQQRALGALYLAAISSEYVVHTGGPIQ